MRSRTLRRTAGGTIIGLGLAAAALGAGVGGGTPATAGGGKAVEARAAAMARFAVFADAGRPGPTGALHPSVVTAAEQSGVDPSEAREVPMPLGAPEVTALPLQEALCVHVVAGEQRAASMGCARWDDALAGRAYLTLSGGPDQEDGEALVVGIVPDGSGDVVLDEQGGAETLEVNDGVYVAEASDPEQLSVTAPDGATTTIDLGELPGANE